MTSLLVGFDGSPSSATAIEVAARLFPGARATVAHVWAPRPPGSEVRRRLRDAAESLDEVIAQVEREGAAEAERLAADGVAIAAQAGLEARAHVSRSDGDEGQELARLARELEADALVLGSRGLGGVKALLGSTSDLAVHVSRVPVLVVPHPLADGDLEAAASGPVLVGYDGSAGARAALAVAGSLFGERELVAVSAGALEDGAPQGAGDAPAEVVTLEDAGRGARGAADALTACARERGAAALVVGSRGRTAAREVLLGSVAKAVAHRADRPVLVAPHERTA